MKSRVIKISCLMIATVLVAISFFAIFKVCCNGKHENKETEIVEVAAIDGYDLANATDEGDGVYKITNDAYNSYTNFLIKNYTGLRAFCGIVNSGNRNFSGKDVYLTADIDCGGANVTVGFMWGLSVRHFEGKVFNGQYHTISNFKIVNSMSVTDLNITRYHYGFFMFINSNTEILNLKLLNYTINSNPGQINAVGGLIGCIKSGWNNINVKISNCVVEQYFDVVDGESSAGFVGSIYDSTGSSVTLNINNCLANNCNNSNAFVYILENMSKSQIVVKNSVVHSTIRSCKIGLVEASNCILSNVDDMSGLSSSIWYKVGDDYNDGFPYLRQFLDWQTINFVAGEGGSVSPSSMEIPSDAESSKVSRLDNTTERMPLYFNYMIYASPNANYDFTKWTWNGSTKTYTANFKQRKATIRIIENNNATLSVNPSKESREYTVYAGTSVDVEIVESYSGINKHKTIQFVFEDVNGVDHVIRYTANSTHYISDTSVGTTGSFTVTGDVEISVNVELKTYDVIFK